MGDQTSDRLLKAVQAIAIAPADANAHVARLRVQSEKDHPTDPERAHQERVADHLISWYANLTAMSGGLTGLSGVIPGLGTAIAILGGGAADIAIGIKLQVDMCMCLASNYGHDLNEPDARHLAFLIAAGSSLEKAGVDTGVQIASKAGVNMLRQYLKGAALQAIKEMFQKLGLVFTRKALEKSLPLGIGVVLGAGGDYALTRYVGGRAKAWFALNRDEKLPVDGELVPGVSGPTVGPPGAIEVQVDSAPERAARAELVDPRSEASEVAVPRKL